MFCELPTPPHTHGLLHDRHTCTPLHSSQAACCAHCCSTVRVWADGKCVNVLEGHEGAVQAVLFLPSGELASGSNDSTIRVWAGGRCLHTIAGHSDTVR